MSGLRCFAAVPLADCLLEPLLEACSAVRDTDPRWVGEKWVPADNLHLTLKFFGSVDRADIEPLGVALGEAIAAQRAFDLPFAGVRPVPNPRRCSMLWASFLDPEGHAASLAEAIERAALPFGIELDERSYKPHATLVRARRPHAVTHDALAAAADALAGAPHTMSVERATFVESQLGARSPVYRELGSWELVG